MIDDKLYLYAIIFSQIKINAIQGINGADIQKVSHADLAAIVSRAPNGKIRPQRKNLAAHQNVLKSLMDNTTPLPVHFGMIADNKSAVEALLTGYHNTLIEQLQYVENQVEMGLRVTWDVPNIFEYFVNRYPKLQGLRDQAFNGGREPARDEMIEIGRLFNQLLEQERETHTQSVEAGLAPVCTEIKRNPPRQERDTMNLVCLVPRSQLNAFEQTIYEIAKQFSDDFLFDFNGPWAPHNFVNMNIHW
jgi:hypothetical protein